MLSSKRSFKGYSSRLTRGKELILQLLSNHEERVNILILHTRFHAKHKHLTLASNKNSESALTFLSKKTKVT